MYATTSVLKLGNYKRKTDKWEGLQPLAKTWTALKTVYSQAWTRSVNCQCAGGTTEPFRRTTNHVADAPAIDMMVALDNLALAVTSNKTTVQHLTAAKLLLTETIAALTATNKHLSDALARCGTNNNPGGGGNGGGSNNGNGGGGGGGDGTNITVPIVHATKGNYCWTHGYHVAHTVKPTGTKTMPR